MSLQDAFARFAQFGSGKAAGSHEADMDGAHFTKLCKDCHLVDAKLTTTDIDLIFTQSHVKGARKINFAEFQKALAQIAKKKGVDVTVVEQAVLSAAPKSSGTQAADSGIVQKLTDTSHYTGAHKERFDEDGKGKGLAGRESVAKGAGHVPAGGHSHIGHAGKVDLADITDRSPCDARGLPKQDAGPAPSKPAAAAVAAPSQPPPADLAEAFQRFCALSGTADASHMDGARFVKFCKDTGLVDKAFTTTDVDIIFSKILPKGQRKVDHGQFVKALELVAAKKKTTLAALEQQILQAGAPRLTGTAAADAGIVSKLTDSSLYTGAHKQRFDESGSGRGLAGRVDKKTGDLSDITDRTAADVRGVKK